MRRVLSIVAVLALASVLAACGDSEPPPPTPASGEGDVARSADPAPAASPLTMTTPLIARELLFGNPERASGRISPDGRWVGFVAPDEGVLNVYVAPAATPDRVRVVTRDRKRGIRAFAFAYAPDVLLYQQDENGDENFRVHAVDLRTGDERVLTPAGARASIAAVSHLHPGRIVVSVNDRDPQYFDLVEIDLASGESKRVFENREFAGLVVDDELKLRFASKQTPEGGTDYFVREGEGWKPWAQVPQEDTLTSGILGLTTDGLTLYFLDSRGRDTGALYAIDLGSGDKVLLHEDPRADVEGVMTHPTSGAVQAVSVNYLRTEWKALSEPVRQDLARLSVLGDGEVDVVSRTLDDGRWVVVLTRSDASARYFLYEHATGVATPWFDTRPGLAGVTLAPMHGRELKSRDGLTLTAFLTLPQEADPDKDGKPSQPVPMVLYVHGGPWARDAWGLDPVHQWLANRGYAVLAVNFRGSTGFGKKFVGAGDKQWGRKMHDDLLDAVDWAVAQGIAQRDKVAIMGGSYGGYAVLAGLAFTPEVFACGVDIVGPSNLETLLASIPPYWAPIKRQFATRMGDPETEEGRALLKERSPLYAADKISKPLLIGQGANDPRVKQAESDQIVAAMKAKNIPVSYVLYPDEGHGFVRPANRLSFNAVAEEFLGRCLGGRVEPIGDDLTGASLTVPEGLDLLPGLKAAMEASKAGAAASGATPSPAASPAASPSPAATPKVTPTASPTASPSPAR